MATIMIRETGAPGVADQPQWTAEITSRSKSTTITLHNPFISAEPSSFADVVSGTAGSPGSEESLSWYLENHINEPFETTRAETAAESLSTYGTSLATQLTRSGLVPRSGDIQLHIISSPPKASTGGPSIQQLHWEVLEDVRVWPKGYNNNLASVSVIRSVTSDSTGTVVGHDAATPPAIMTEQNQSKKASYKILLVVSRPRPEKDVEYQLVAKCLVAIVSHVSKTNPGLNVSLKILRPPTWQAFCEHLSDYQYDLVHFDVKGEIVENERGGSKAVLQFCRPDLNDPLKMKKDLHSGEEIAQMLSKAGVRTVVLNACNSAASAFPGSNLAELLLSHSRVQSVLAMSYKIVEEAVEIFMSAFYQSLLAQQVSINTATRVARSALLQNKSRRAKYMHNVQLSDYIVPVLYTRAPTLEIDAGVDAQEKSGPFRSYITKLLTSIKQVTPGPWKTTEIVPRAVPPSLEGRDFNILTLEMLLSASRVILMHGQGGCGKTELLRYVCKWWKSSGWIHDAVYVDFSRRTMYSMDNVVGVMAGQLGLVTPDEDDDGKSLGLETQVLNKFRSGKYLLVFDSAEVFKTSINLERPTHIGELPAQLQAFIEAATVNESMVIVSSRLDKTEIAHIPSNRQKYLLPGLSVIDSVDLLQDLSFNGPGKPKPPELFYHRANIDALRRAAILLEGNPAAIQLIVPELEKVNYSGELLLHNLLYGVCKTHEEDEDLMEKCRFVKTLYFALTLPSFIDFNKTFISPVHFAPFWTLMPKDLNVYYWFLYLSSQKYFQEGTYANWVSQEWKDAVSSAQIVCLKAHWSDVETKLINAGILNAVTITRNNGQQTSCYHVHPIYTLISRSFLREEGWQTARFAYIRQALLWDKAYIVGHIPRDKVAYKAKLDAGEVASDRDDDGGEGMEWRMIQWDSSQTRQHDDHLYNWRVVAVGWSQQDGKPLEEVEKSGMTIFDLTYRLMTRAVFGNTRQGRLVKPHVHAHLLQAHMIVDLLRAEKIPTRSDLHSIIDYSWTLYTLETDDVTQATKLGIVNSALEIVDRWQAYERRHGRNPVLQPPQEVSWFQLRHVQAQLVEETAVDGVRAAKLLYERNLCTDPVTTWHVMTNIIRRWHIQSLNAWAGCVVRLAVKDGDIDREAVREGFRQLSDALTGKVAPSEESGKAATSGKSGKVAVAGKPRKKEGAGMLSWVSKVMSQNREQVEALTVRDQLAFAIEKSPEVVPKFGKLATSILDLGLFDVFGDVFEKREKALEHGGQQGGGATSSNVDKMLKLTMEMAQRKDQESPEAANMRSDFRHMETGLRMLAGDHAGASSVMQAEMAREAMSSTSNTGWEKQAELHMTMHALAMQGDSPDYKRGLLHLDEWWKQHRGIGVSRRDQAYGFLKFLTCYHGLGRLSDAARAAIRITEIIQTFQPVDVVEGDVGAGREWFLEQIAQFERLEVFLDPKIVFSLAPGVRELVLKEKVMMYQIVTQAKEVEKTKKDCEAAFVKAKDTMLQLKKLYEQFPPLQEKGKGAEMDDFLARLDRDNEQRAKKKGDGLFDLLF
ncbi:CHAT domain-protein [Podospora australis]|uniref:CHAT domain-protein n=1 Tax=Podospora australis TaxID=1536484 RepID=A0AAN7AGS6_9PEZI|nr:CHAT domain-protein [Podospora australis]